MASVEDSIQKMLVAYADAVAGKDVDAFMGLYADDARVFDAWDAWSYDSAAAWRVPVQHWLGSLKGDMLVMIDDLLIVSAETFASVSATVTYIAFSQQEGKPPRSLQNRLSWVVVLRGNVWKVVHEHTSAPASFTDKKVILEKARAT